MERKFGILMPVFSLGGEYGCGTFGKRAYDFVDFLHESDVAVWQVLPLCPIGAGGSPYSSPMDGAIDPLFIDPEILLEKGLLTRAECDECKVEPSLHVDYKKLRTLKNRMLKKAIKRYLSELCQTEYAIYCAIKASYHNKPWNKWDMDGSKAIEEYIRTHKTLIAFYAFILSEASRQWLELRNYAKGKNVEILGDMPFYVSYSGADVWLNKDVFMLDGDDPSFVAGVPPDYFSENGQLWGNPVYDWHNKRTYEWFDKRIANALTLYDMVRLDHFRAFDEFYAVPRGAKNAKNGIWMSGPGFELFKGKTHLPIIAEDLGIITPEVKKLLGRTGYPGMSVLQFGFDGNWDNPHLPQNILYNRVCYTGTHDNMTLKQFVCVSDKDKLTAIIKEQGGYGGDDDELVDSIIELGAATDAKLFVVPLFDIMHKGSEFRINTPGTVSGLNWSVVLNEDFSPYKSYIKDLITRYNRKLFD